MRLAHKHYPICMRYVMTHILQNETTHKSAIFYMKLKLQIIDYLAFYVTYISFFVPMNLMKKHLCNLSRNFFFSQNCKNPRE